LFGDADLFLKDFVQSNSLIDKESEGLKHFLCTNNIVQEFFISSSENFFIFFALGEMFFCEGKRKICEGEMKIRLRIFNLRTQTVFPTNSCTTFQNS